MIENEKELNEFIEEQRNPDITHDVIHLDRILMVQFKHLQDVPPMNPVDYINEIVQNYFITLKNYEKSIHAEQPTEV